MSITIRAKPEQGGVVKSQSAALELTTKTQTVNERDDESLEISKLFL